MTDQTVDPVQQQMSDLLNARMTGIANATAALLSAMHELTPTKAYLLLQTPLQERSNEFIDEHRNEDGDLDVTDFLVFCKDYANALWAVGLEALEDVEAEVWDDLVSEEYARLVPAVEGSEEKQ